MKSDLQNPSDFFLDSWTKAVCFELSRILKKLFSIDLPLPKLALLLSPPPERKLGHLAFPCFLLSKKLKKNPAQIALKIANEPSNCFTAKPTGPYVNLFFQKDFLKEKLLIPLLKTKPEANFFSTPEKKIKPYLIEYSQPNTHKELHIGHMRNICFGLSLTTLLKKRGFPVVSCTFPGDVGTHTAKCLWYLKYHNKETVPIQQKGQWLGNLYAKACQKFDKAPTKEAEKNKKQLTEILTQLKNKKGDFFLLWKKTRKWSISLMEEVYTWAGAQFDHWYWESEVDELSVAFIKELYNKNLLQLSQGAIGIDLKKPLGFLLLLKSDGNGLYATKDLYLALKKHKDYEPEKNIYIVDIRQETHFKQIFKTLEHIGYSDIADKSQHLKYNFVELKTGAMSSRKGNIIPIMTLIREMTKYITDNFLQKYEKLWSLQQIQSTANIIAKGAIFFGMNDPDLNKKIVFDMKDWLKLDGRSGTYIQYAYARSCSLLTKNPFDEKKIKDIDIKLLKEEEEWDLLLHLSQFSLIMEKSAWQMKTAPVCQYLFELGKKFSKFYQNCPIKTLNNVKKQNLRLTLVKITQRTLKEGLSSLSIPTSEKM